MIDAGYNCARLKEKMGWVDIDPASIRHILCNMAVTLIFFLPGNTVFWSHETRPWPSRGCPEPFRVL